MLGMDRCSPQKGLSSKMNNCQTPCTVRLENNNHFHCQVTHILYRYCTGCNRASLYYAVLVLCCTVLYRVRTIN